MSDAEAHFREVSVRLFERLRDGEVLLLNHSGEETDFVRLNRNCIRSAGHVHQRDLRLDLIDGAPAAKSDRWMLSRSSGGRPRWSMVHTAAK